MENINITPIIEAGIFLVTAVVSAFFIPWLKSKAKNENTADFLGWVEIAVAAAEQIYKSTEGAAKKLYVLEYLRGKGVVLDEADIENAIEAAVLKLHAQLYSKEGESVNA